jgi:large subunit ribosomal protein L13
MDMNKAFYLRKEDCKPHWRVIDAKGKVLGRLATELADLLRGKHTPLFSPHTDTGDYIVIINAEKIVLTGRKMTDKIYEHYTGWIGGLRQATAAEVLKKHPEDLITLAVKRMLPKNKLSRQMMRKLLVYAGENHPHQAQVNHEAKRLA